MVKALFWILIAIVLSSCGGGGGGSSTASDATGTTAPTETTPDICSSLLEGVARGLMCLHCTQPEARAQANLIVRIMRDSCLRRLATAYLVDNTFGYDEGLLREHIRTLTEGGRTPVITYYLGNGPAQRRFDITQIVGFGATINPEDFRTLIQSDPTLQGQYQDLVRRIVPVLEEAISRGAVVIVVPMLEDNLTDVAYLAMRQLTIDALPPGLPVLIGRNICAPGCFAGNEGLIPGGVIPEIHQATPPVTVGGGTISNDGFDYTSPAFPGNPDAVTTLDQMRTLRDEANALGNSFILWSAERQGLPPGSEAVAFPLPAQRSYAIPSAEEIAELTAFLREGL